MQWLSQFIAHDYQLTEISIRLLVIVIVLAIERRVAIDASYHPGTLWRFIAMKLPHKTAKGSAAQQQLAGVLSTLLLVFIGLIIVYSILLFATYPWFFHAIFLGLAINSHHLLLHTQRIYQSLHRGKKVLAREQLGFLCIRNTATLSNMGIAKACIEGAIQQFSLKYFAPIVIYLVAGPLALIIYVLLQSLAQYWNPKLKKHREFGKVLHHIVSTITTPLHGLVAVHVACLYGLQHLSLARNNWHHLGSGVLLSTTANAMNRELGGAVIYDNIKISRQNLGPKYPPNTQDIKHLHRLLSKLRQSLSAILLITLLFSLIPVFSTR